MDTDSSKGLRLLSLDGGGVRGLASLLILKRIMYNLDSKLSPEVERPLLPCNFFDMIAGTSTGGLIAVMLGVLRMDIDTCISKYLSMAPEIFPEEGFVSGSKWGKIFKGVRGEARFDAKNLEKVVKKMVCEALGDQKEDAPLQIEQPEEGPPQCRTFVCVTNKDVGKPFRLRTYRSAWEPGTECTIWQAARATSAAPLYFPSVGFGEPPANYVDGGLNYNNPVRSLYDEAKHVWGKSRREIKCIISIGTGVPPLRSTGNTGKQILKWVVDIATDTQRIADEFADEMEHLAAIAPVDYFRWNVDRGLGEIKLEEWKDFDMLAGATSYFLNSHKADLDRCANVLLELDASEKLPEGCTLLSDLPKPRDAFFGRASELAQLRTMLSLSTIGTSRQQRAVLWGLGGFGKTRIALEYLKTYQEDYSAILWINAATYDSAEESFAQAANILISRGSFHPDAPSVGARANTRLVHQWLTSNKNIDWLMIIDSLDDLESFDCRDLVPECSHGNIIVTSTQSHTKNVFQSQGLELGSLEIFDGCKMLLDGVGAEADSEKEIQTEIVRALSGVALSIEQARAMIKQGMSARDFLGHYKTQYQKLMAQKPARSAWDYDKNMSIIGVFNMLLARMQNGGNEEKLLAFISCFGPRQVAVNLMGQVRELGESSLSSGSDWSDALHTDEMIWLDHLWVDRLEFQIATGQLESLCVFKRNKDSEGNIVSISLHDSITRWRFETLTNDMRGKWIIAAAYALSKCLPKIIDQKSQMKLLPLVRHFYSIISRCMEPQSLEAPGGKFCHHYGNLMTRFAQLYLNSGYTVEGESVFLQALSYQKDVQMSSWPKGRRTLLLLKGFAMMLSKNGKMEDAAETTETLHDASMEQLGPEDEITRWAAARLPAVRDTKQRNANNEHRAIVASQGGKFSSSTPGFTSNESLRTSPRRVVREYDEDPSTRLTHAANIGDIEATLERGCTALSAASGQGHVWAIRMLLDHGADVNARDGDGKIALLEASHKGHLAVAEMVLRYGADVNVCDEWNGTALHSASQEGHTTVAELLLKNGADVNVCSDTNEAALHLASSNGHVAVAELLLKNGADVNIRGEFRETALHVASYGGSDMNADFFKYGTLFTYATALHAATFNGDLSIVQLLIKNGADVNARSDQGTPLQIASSRSLTDFVDLLKAAGARDDD